jgi:hypothetical protein
MFERMKHRGYLQGDETPVKVMDPEIKGQCARGYWWFYAVPGGDVFLDFQGPRGRAAPHAQLSGFTGTLQTDASAVYDSVQKLLPELIRIGDAAHSRRKFRRALRDGDRRAIAFMAQFRQLYWIERQTKDLAPEARHQIRQKQAAPIWAQLQQDAQALQPRLLPNSSLGKAVRYLINEDPALLGYGGCGAYRIDNNLVANSSRVPAVGRRRWLFIGHPAAGGRSAVIDSLIVSCRRHGINPQDYRTDVLRRLPSLNSTQIGPLLPECWKAPPSDAPCGNPPCRPPLGTRCSPPSPDRPPNPPPRIDAATGLMSVERSLHPPTVAPPTARPIDAPCLPLTFERYSLPYPARHLRCLPI